MKTPSVLPVRMLAAASVAFAAWVPQAGAAALYDANAGISLWITGISNLQHPTDLSGLGIIGSTLIGDASHDASGAASALPVATATVDALDPSKLRVGEGVTLVASASGNSAASGQSFAQVLTSGQIALNNSSSADTYAISFKYLFASSAIAHAANPGVESASASAGLGLTVDSKGDLLNSFIAADTAQGQYPGAVPLTSAVFSVSLAPKATDTMNLSADAFGQSVSAVPEPATLAMAAVGLVVLLARTRVKRRANRRRPADSWPN